MATRHHRVAGSLLSMAITNDTQNAIKFQTEAVEVCPHCDNENVYPMWDVAIKGYVAVCRHCGAEIFLCDECFHAEDNPNMKCDWCSTEFGGKCFRGIVGKEKSK